jgi:hypothetical protein
MSDWRNLQSELRSYQQKNGLFFASPNSKNEVMTSNIWTRDNRNIAYALPKQDQKKIAIAYKNLVNRDEKENRFDQPPEKDSDHINPIYNKSLERLQEWAFVQIDAVGNQLELLSQFKFKHQADLIIKYYKSINFPNCADSGWQENEKQIHSSSIATSLRGFLDYIKNFDHNPDVLKLLSIGYQKLHEILPNETHERKADLGLTEVLWPKKLVNNDLEKEIIKNLQTLEGRWGLIRFKGDTWDGVTWPLGLGNEMQWTMGLSKMYLITKGQDYIIRLREIYKKFGYMPEGIINGESNETNLTESLALYICAE